MRFVSALISLATLMPAADMVSFPSGALTLRGVLYRPEGQGPFPAVLYNHGSAMDSSAASDALGPLFAKRGWVFFMPSRRGQGLSASTGPYIRDEINAAFKAGGISAAAATAIRLLETDHLSDQRAALAWLRQKNFVRPDRIVLAGQSFGGILTLLGIEREPYCAAIDLSGGAESWSRAPELRATMTRAARNARAPVFFIQAENDYDLSPTRILSSAMKDAGKEFQAKIYPPFGNSAEEGHSFAYAGATVWVDDAIRFLEQHCGTDAH